MNRAALLKDKLLNYLEYYNQNGAVGIDDYCSSPVYHSMADALFLRFCHSLYFNQLISKSSLHKYQKAALLRLKENILSQGSNNGWGLGFSWGELPKSEIYTITSSMVLFSVSKFTEESKLSINLKQVGVDCLINKELCGGWLKLPFYSTKIEEHVINTWAYAAMALAASNNLSKFKRLLLKYKLSLFDKSIIGWQYSYSSSRVDLLHQAYIADALIELGNYQSAVKFYREEFDHFKSPEGYIDKIDLISLDDLSKINVVFSKNTRTVKYLKNYVIYYRDPARAWSLGFHLAVVSKLLTKKLCHEDKLSLESKAQFLFENLIDIDLTTIPVRHSVHIALGISEFLFYLKGK